MLFYASSVAVQEGCVHCQKTQPPWEFLLSASRNSLQSYELSRLSHAANLRKEISALLDQWLEENASAMLARWLGGVFASIRCREPNFLAPAHPAQAPHTRALPPPSSALQFLAAMRPSPSYVLAALYLLGDTNAERFQDVRAKAHSRSSKRQQRPSKTSVGGTYLAGAAAGTASFSRSCSLR